MRRSRQVPADAFPDGPIPAAQYVRMSTEHQKYSTENQADVIAAYAARRGFTIIKTYADEGRSGLSLDGRDALKTLIKDVRDGSAGFAAILVYDISRWGRFQDADESAYYEYICKEAGIRVLYCAEQFENDGSLTSTIIKNMKRAMAGEYSRDLSARVFKGQCKLVTLGYRQGGSPGYGLRRTLIDEHGRPKADLARGEYKSLQTDRVILTPGPPNEVGIIRRIYQSFVIGRNAESEIAAELNREGISNEFGRPWSRGTIHQILTNEKYIGNNVYNRVSFKLKQKRVVNPQEIWVRAENAFEGVIEAGLFAAASSIIDERCKHFSDEDMLRRLSSLLSDKGYLSGLVIDEVDDMPSSSIYRARFGSLLRAYQLVGYKPDRDFRYLETNRALRSMYPDILRQTIAGIRDCGGVVELDPLTDVLTVNGEFTASIIIARSLRTSAGSLRWKIRLDASLRPDISIAVRMDGTNETALDYYLLPSIDITTDKLKLAEENGLRLDAYRFDNLDMLFRLSTRDDLGAAA
ncbi:MAG TPA: recombinase family protein [Rhodopseudomonas sp.]|uniref:recombinase family protein n=1 Tax=Rhodopseudomonas sp. TaxID=1078 RepID=UPI002ED9119E